MAFRRNELNKNRKDISFLTWTESFSYIEGVIFMALVLSKRLEMIASFIPKGAVFADIGSDHAYIPCAICKKDETARGVAGEVREGPFQSAQKTVRIHGLDDQIDVRLGDGLDVIDATVNHLIIAGMGGSLIASILEKGKDRLPSVQEMILQPNVGSCYVRTWLYRNDFILKEEEMIEENGHIYEVLVAKRQDKIMGKPHSKELYFGPKLLETKPPLFIKKWQREKVHLERIVEQMKNGKNLDQNQLHHFEQQIIWIEEVLDNNA